MLNVTKEMEPSMFYTHHHLFTVLILVFTTLVGVPGNALVLWVTGVKMKWTMTTIWFWNLALADIICCLSIPLIVAQFFYPDWLYGPVLCKILPFIVPLNMYTSVFTLVTISIDRCILVVWPIWARNHRWVKTAWLVCLALWMLSFLMCLPKLIYQKFYSFQKKTRCISEGQHTVASTYTHMIFGFLLPFLIICTCYISIVFKVRSSKFKAPGQKITKVALAIIVAFFITWAPYHIMSLVLQFTEHDVLDSLSQALAQFNSCINPILYVLMGKEMKNSVKKSILALMQNTFREDSLRTPRRNDLPIEEEMVPLELRERREMPI